MEQPAISVQDLGKLYRLDHRGDRPDSFRDALASLLATPFRRVRQLQGVDESMEEFWALRHVSFDVQKGEVLGVIGRNGAGKSTLLKILSRIVEPTEGRAVIRGRVASLLEVGTGFHPELSGRENIFLNGSIIGMRRREIQSKFDEIVAFAEVEKFLDTPVKRYSSGMYVRLAFAVAAHLDPEVLIVDEVLAVGDAQFQKKCIGKMKDIAEGGTRTVVFVSHNMGAVRSLCSSCIYLDKGTVAKQGAVETIIAEYLRAGVTVSRRGVKSRWGIELLGAGLFQPGQEEPVGALYFMNACTIRVTLRAHEEFPLTGLVVRVYDELGTLVSSLNSCEEGIDAFTMRSDHTFTFSCARISLLPGRYTVSVYVYRPHDSTKYLEVEDAFGFEVLPATLPGGLVPYTREHGIARFVDQCTLS